MHDDESRTAHDEHITDDERAARYGNPCFWYALGRAARREHGPAGREVALAGLQRDHGPGSEGRAWQMTGLRMLDMRQAYGWLEHAFLWGFQAEDDAEDRKRARRAVEAAEATAAGHYAQIVELEVRAQEARDDAADQRRGRRELRDRLMRRIGELKAAIVDLALRLAESR